MKRFFAILAAAAACSVPAAVSPTCAETTPNRPEAAQLLADAADAGTYTFLLFYRDRGAGTQAMLRTIERIDKRLSKRTKLKERAR